MSAQPYVAQVDRLLAAAASIFPDPAQRLEPIEVESPAVADIPGGGGRLSAAADEATTRYSNALTEANAVNNDIAETAAGAADAARRGSEALARIRDSARSQAAAIAPTDQPAPPEALKALVETMDAKLQAAQDQIASTRGELEQAAQRLRGHHLTPNL